MAQQIKKKFIGNDQIDSTKIKLLPEQSIRGTDSTGSEVDLIKLGESDQVLVKGSQVSLKADLDAEEAARISAVSDLQSQIDNIVSNVDPAALDSLTEIVEAFQSADSDLNAAITALGTGAQSALNDEIAARIAADTDLQNQLDAEEAARISADQGLQSSIDNVASDLSQEVSDRTLADSVLQSNIDTVAANLAQEILDRQSDVDTEEQRALAAEGVLQDNIDQEVLDRQTLEGEFDAYVISNDAALAQEVSDRQTAISNEESARISADNTLQSNIDTVSSNLSQEIVDRQAGDQSLEDSKVNRSGDTLTGNLIVDKSSFGTTDTGFALKAITVSGADRGLKVETSNPENSVYMPEGGSAFVNGSAISSEVRSTGLFSQMLYADGFGYESAFGGTYSYIGYYDTQGNWFPKLATSDDEVTTKAYVDQEINALSSGGLAQVQADLAQEILDRQSGDSNLQSQIDTEKGRIDAILLASDADKDSFAEIVTLINSIDTENDNAFAGYVLSNDARSTQIEADLAQEVSDRQTLEGEFDAYVVSNDAALAQEVLDRQTLEGEFDAYVISNNAALAQEVSDRQSADSVLQSNIDTVSANLAQEILDRQADVDAEETRALAAEGVLQSNIDSEESARIAADDALDVRVSVLESVVFFKEKFVLTSTDISNGFVTLAHSPESNSMSAFVDRLAIHEGASEDYSISGTTMTFLNSLVSPGQENLQAGDTVYVKYQYKM